MSRLLFLLASYYVPLGFGTGWNDNWKPRTMIDRLSKKGHMKLTPKEDNKCSTVKSVSVAFNKDTVQLGLTYMLKGQRKSEIMIDSTVEYSVEEEKGRIYMFLKPSNDEEISSVADGLRWLNAHVAGKAVDAEKSAGLAVEQLTKNTVKVAAQLGGGVQCGFEKTIRLPPPPPPPTAGGL
ncbi:hypothetical protein FOL47_002975 [Perkinsus chesapeaki]|uniref:Uncharacterized protein n=1 Tax=Perkinsus chesapeaki TaxID=330153 RepID=A0A7J6MAE6_PERCH|nr:hypothetical protein FOL47_002975 [Perkinsus chesapeaki]